MSIVNRKKWKVIRTIDLSTDANYKSWALHRYYPRQKELLVWADHGYALLYDMRTGKLKKKVNLGRADVAECEIDRERNRLITVSKSFVIEVYDLQTQARVLTVKSQSGDALFAFTPDNKYMTVGAVGNQIFFRKDGQLYPFEQFDLHYNRPDLVLKNVGCDDYKYIEALHHAYLKRVKRSGNDIDNREVAHSPPTITILGKNRLGFTTHTNNLWLNIKASDQESKITHVKVWINKVPIYGKEGLKIDGDSNIIQESLQLTLSEGKNRVEVAAMNEHGVESAKDYFNIHCLLKSRDKKVYFIGIGVAAYQQAGYDLTYTTKDVKDLNGALKNRYPNLESILLLDEEVTTENILKLRKTLETTGVDDKVIILLSGHGVLDSSMNFFFATHDTDFEEPGQKAFSYQSLDNLLYGIPARHKLVLLDACFSGEVDSDAELQFAQMDSSVVQKKTKGARVVKFNKTAEYHNSFKLMQHFFNDFSEGNGAIVLSAAGGDEYALEGGGWQNGVFTYSILKGLVDMEADQNLDQTITVQELTKYVNHKVEKLTGGRQKPTSRQSNLELDYRVW